jgi:hypothetical protein
MDHKLAIPLLVAALILGASVIGGSLLVKGALDRGTEELGGVKSALGEFKTALAEAGRPAGRAAAPAAGRPDPNRRYTINTSGSPAKGGAKPKVTLIEFSDFQ